MKHPLHHAGGLPDRVTPASVGRKPDGASPSITDSCAQKEEKHTNYPPLAERLAWVVRQERRPKPVLKSPYMSKDIREVSDLVGEQLSAVCFVRDYVEFHFDGPILRSLSNPSAFVDGTEHHFPNPGSRDALCRFVGSTVRAVKLEDHRAFEVTTTDDCKITIPLDVKTLRAPEAMHFVPQWNGPIQVW